VIILLAIDIFLLVLTRAREGTQFDRTRDTGGFAHLYIWPNIAPNAADPNDTSSFWGLGVGTDIRAGGSHVPIVFGGAGVPQLQVSNGVMTVNLVSPVRASGTEAWHPKIQYPPWQPEEAHRISSDLEDVSMNVENRSPSDIENWWTPTLNRYIKPVLLDAKGVRTVIKDRILMDAVQYHIKHDSGNPSERWQSLAILHKRKWTPKGLIYRNQWRALMLAVSQMLFSLVGIWVRVPSQAFVASSLS
jgi:hypothetical protein